ncbi:MAG TPA: hypothetical protein VIK72_01620 [Clostridiaceae bacterium]
MIGKVEPKYGALKSRTNDILSPTADITKIKALLNWDVRIDLSSGIKRTIEYYRDNKALYVIRG